MIKFLKEKFQAMTPLELTIFTAVVFVGGFINLTVIGAIAALIISPPQ